MVLENKFFELLVENCLPWYLDGSNIAYFQIKRNKKPKLSNIVSMIHYIKDDLSIPKENIYCICDPALKYYIDKPIEYQALIKDGFIIEAPKVADEFILSFALKQRFCFIISNDRFREYINQLPNKEWLEDRRVPFMFLREEVCLSPNIEYKRKYLLIANEKKTENLNQKTTLEVLNTLKNNEGEFNLF